MRAVRNEQNARCTLDKPYTTNGADLAAFPKHEGSNTNYTYALDNTGISATRSDGSYTLRIPAYDSGQICCEGGACNSLNKGYPGCGGITDGSGCAAEGGGVGGEPPVTPLPCTDGSRRNVVEETCSTRGEVCNGGSWESFTEDYTEDCRHPECSSKPEGESACPVVRNMGVE